MTQMGYAAGLILRYAHAEAALGFAGRTGWEAGTQSNWQGVCRRCLEPYL